MVSEGRVRQDPGLRPGEADGAGSGERGDGGADGLGRDGARHRHGHGGLHVAGAGAGEASGLPVRSVFARLDSLRDGDRAARVPPGEHPSETLSAIIRDEPEVDHPRRAGLSAAASAGSSSDAWPRSPTTGMPRRATSRATSRRCATASPSCPSPASAGRARRGGRRDPPSGSPPLRCSRSSPWRESSRDGVSRACRRRRFTPVTYRRGSILSARFAPDGQTVVYSAAWDGKPPRLFLKRPDSPDEVPIALPERRHPLDLALAERWRSRPTVAGRTTASAAARSRGPP